MFARIEEQLEERLKERLADTHILTAADLENVKAERQPTPAVHLVYQGYTVTETRPDGLAARVNQQWLAVAVVRNARAIRTGAASRSATGALADQVVQALMGFKSEHTAKPVQLANAPAPVYMQGVAYFPVAFSVETTVNSGADQ